jgi:hypothetical protein
MDDPTLRRLQRHAKNSTALAHAITSLSSDIDRLDAAKLEPRVQDYTEVWDTSTQALAIANNNWLSLTRRIQAVQMQAHAASLTASDMAEAAADSVMLNEQIEQIMRLAYIPWSRHTQQLLPELLTVAVKEVLSHAGGKTQLELLRDAINGVLSPAEGQL